MTGQFQPSSPLVHGTIQGVDCVLLRRHGVKHTISPSNINYRANLLALHDAGCTHIMVSSAVGSLKEEIHPGDIVMINSFIDRTQGRKQTFYDGTSTSGRFDGVCHIPMHEPFCTEISRSFIQCIEELGFRNHVGGTAVIIEGPRFSTRSESEMYRSFGASVVGMTVSTEVVLAAELGLPYVAACLVTDYDTWHSEQASVDVPGVMKTLEENAGKMKKIFTKVVLRIEESDYETLSNYRKEMTQAAIM